MKPRAAPTPLNPQQSLVKCAQLAGLLGVDQSTLYRWTNEDVRVRNCLFRTGYYSVQKLRDAGLLVLAAPVAPAVQEGLGNVG